MEIRLARTVELKVGIFTKVSLFFTLIITMVICAQLKLALSRFKGGWMIRNFLECMLQMHKLHKLQLLEL